MRESPATLLVVSHDRRLLETVCDRLWVVDDERAVAFDGGYRAWRAAVADGWTTKAAEAARRARSATPRAAASGPSTTAKPTPATSTVAKPTGTRQVARRTRGAKLSKDAYRRQRSVLDAELTRLGLRKNHLELAMGDPSISANFVEMRRVTSELADVTDALAVAEDAWLDLEERAP
jgi:ATPase subunit of ABC transporter with duplicated ATPase domains